MLASTFVYEKVVRSSQIRYEKRDLTIDSWSLANHYSKGEHIAVEAYYTLTESKEDVYRKSRKYD